MDSPSHPRSLTYTQSLPHTNSTTFTLRVLHTHRLTLRIRVSPTCSLLLVQDVCFSVPLSLTHTYSNRVSLTRFLPYSQRHLTPGLAHSQSPSDSESLSHTRSLSPTLSLTLKVSHTPGVTLTLKVPLTRQRHPPARSHSQRLSRAPAHPAPRFRSRIPHAAAAAPRGRPHRVRARLAPARLPRRARQRPVTSRWPVAARMLCRTAAPASRLLKPRPRHVTRRRIATARRVGTGRPAPRGADGRRRFRAPGAAAASGIRRAALRRRRCGPSVCGPRRGPATPLTGWLLLTLHRGTPGLRGTQYGDAPAERPPPPVPIWPLA